MPEFTIEIETAPGMDPDALSGVMDEIGRSPSLRDANARMIEVDNERAALVGSFRAEGSTLASAVSTGVSSFQLALRLAGAGQADIVSLRAQVLDRPSLRAYAGEANPSDE